VTRQVDAAAAWIYRGVWASVVGFFKVPQEPSTLPAAGEPVRSLRPSPGYLRYLKFLFWVALIPGDILPVVGWIAVSIAVPVLGVVLALPFLALMVLPDVFAYVGIHLRYDTTWYVLTDRSLRIRRGIMTIHETTISFENVQNVEVRQGPLQRYFGIADVLVTTAGGGVASHGKGQTSSLGAHIGILQGLDDAEAVRNQILASVERTRTAGLGDERPAAGASAAPAFQAPGFSPQQLAVLREIRDTVGRLAPS
jgi:membrane protein YdbS with pleckstrin-like domain